MQEKRKHGTAPVTLTAPAATREARLQLLLHYLTLGTGTLCLPKEVSKSNLHACLEVEIIQDEAFRARNSHPKVTKTTPNNRNSRSPSRVERKHSAKVVEEYMDRSENLIKLEQELEEGRGALRN